MGDETLNILPDGIDLLKGGVEANQEEEQEEQQLELTIDEKKKLLRAMGNKEITDEEIAVLTEEQIEEIKDFAKLREKKALYRFVYRKKNVTDDDVKDMTDEELQELTSKALIMSQHLTYRPKKNFGVDYKKKRQNRNKLTKQSRRANR